MKKSKYGNGRPFSATVQNTSVAVLVLFERSVGLMCVSFEFWQALAVCVNHGMIYTYC